MDLLIRRYGRLIDVSPDGRAPLDPRIVDRLRSELSYQKRTFIRGHHRYGPDGTRHGNVDIQHRQMYAIEEGRLTTSYGFYPRIVQVLQSLGCQLGYVDMTPPHPRADRYVQDWERVYQYCTFRHEVQRYCLQQIANSDQGLIVACPGFGKTHQLEALCHLFPYAKIHIAVRPVDVAMRIFRDLSRTLPNVGIVGGGGNAYGDRITVFVAASLHKSDGDADIFVGDEGHLLLAENSAAEIGRAYRFARMFLMTATPVGRSDGTDVRMEMLCGPCIFRLTYQQGVDCNLVVPIRVRWLPIRLAGNPAEGKTGVPHERWGVWRNRDRNRIIAEDCRTNYGPNDQVLHLCSKVEHAIHLARELPEYALCYGEQDPKDIAQFQKNHMLPDGFAPITRERRDQLREAFERGDLKKAIATDVWATGVSFDQLQVMYRTDARQSAIIDGQAPARVSRIYEGKAYGEVVDCYDAFDEKLLRASQTRHRHYKEFGWAQEWPNTRGNRGGTL